MNNTNNEYTNEEIEMMLVKVKDELSEIFNSRMLEDEGKIWFGHLCRGMGYIKDALFVLNKNPDKEQKY